VQADSWTDVMKLTVAVYNFADKTNDENLVYCTWLCENCYKGYLLTKFCVSPSIRLTRILDSVGNKTKEYCLMLKEG
jgi:hypothetical protein